MINRILLATSCFSVDRYETGRNLDCRIKEHKQSTKKQDVASIIAVHHVETKHRINWEEATCIDFNVFEDERIFIESWFTKCNEFKTASAFAANCQEHTLEITAHECRLSRI